MHKRYASLWFRHLLTDRLAIRQPDLKNAPFVLAAPQHNRIVITAVNALALQQGITPGMAAADAKAVIPNLKVIDDVPGRSAMLLRSIGEWCIRYSPLIAVDEPDGLILDITGCTHLWGGEEAYLKEVIARLAAKGYTVRGAIADTIGAAWAIARFGKEQFIVEPGMHTDAMLKLSPAALRLDSIILDRLHKLGFYSIRRFMGLKRQALRRRFGDHFLLRIDQAMGTIDEPLLYLHPQEAYYEHLPSLEPVRTAGGIEVAIKTLLQNLCKRLKNEGKGLRTAVLKCYRIDGKVVGAEIGTNRPTYNTTHLFKLFELKIASIEPALGIELFTLTAPKVEDISIEQEAIWAPDGCGLNNSRLAELLDKLANKIGANNIHRYLPQESYWPERTTKKTLNLTENAVNGWSISRPRPSLLLKKPEPIAVTFKLPDNPPMLFVYKGEKHIVKKADDAERIEPEWWRTTRPHRDYYIVEDEQGRRYWLFRSGHFDAEGSRWYIHGFFA
ncbi:DNA polymerase Y family protein [Mucilaginibacter terrenus]|uniref:DNA polymerase Y family protein n=1 Tax=Mucilaginibacter terrenus TaxID=2482727 RepID=A0A3E2NTE5_9SPHI|nr:DNA polymerase Y family protein [Mucilaginibacter terrenus]RFZ84283.1 DNA polymerase Y family protein [Mucilaginibacter terrenus]